MNFQRIKKVKQDILIVALNVINKIKENGIKTTNLKLKVIPKSITKKIKRQE